MNDYEPLLLGNTLRRKFDDEFPDDDYITDIDWYRTELEVGKIYEFTVAPESDFYIELSLHTQSGGQISREDLEHLEYEGLGIKTYFRPDVAGYYFSKVYDPLEESSGYYLLSAREVTDLPAYTNTPARLRENGFYDRAIGQAGDIDWFRIELFGLRSYQFHIAGSSFPGFSLDDPFLRVYDEEGNLLDFNNNAGLNTLNSKLRFTAPASGTYFLSVSDAGEGQGHYRVSTKTLDDYRGGPNTTGRLPVRENQLTVTRGDLETNDDIDWFQLELREGKWYRFRIAGEGQKRPTLRLLDSNWQVVAREANPGDGYFYYQAPSDETHFLAARNGASGGYYVGVTDNRLPELETTERLFEVEHASEFAFESLFDIEDLGFTPSDYQIYSRTPMEYRGVQQEGRRGYTVPADELGLYQFPDSITPGIHELYIRATPETDHEEGPQTGWRMATISKAFNTSFLESDTVWNEENKVDPDGSIRVAFPDVAPEYFESSGLTEFRSLRGRAIDSAARSFVRSLKRIIPIVRLVPNPLEADINVYMADLSSSVEAFEPGTDLGGDVILNRRLYTNIGVNSDYLTFAMIRGFGKALGLKESAPQLSLDQSVMGNNRETTNGVFPSSFSPGDIDELHRLYGTQPDREPSPGISFTQDDEFFQTYYDDQPLANSYFYNRSNRPANVDLRPSGLSYLLGEGPSQTYQLHNEVSLFGYVGNSRSDTIQGNSFDNTIWAYGGQDYLAGGTGDDELYGGSGNDTYVFKTGWGEDTILDVPHTETADGGVDTLRIFTNFAQGNLATDLSFRRAGNDLHIDLDLNGTYTGGNGLVQIEEMSSLQQRIEKLEIWVGNRHLDTYSLPSLWEQSTPFKQRFEGTGDSDTFGQLVRPV